MLKVSNNYAPVIILNPTGTYFLGGSENVQMRPIGGNKWSFRSGETVVIRRHYVWGTPLSLRLMGFDV